MKAICSIAIAATLLHCLDLRVQALDNGLAITPPMVGSARRVQGSHPIRQHIPYSQAHARRGGTPGILFTRTSRRRWYVKARRY